MKTYRTGFLLALTGNIVLVAVLTGLWWHYRVVKLGVDAKPQEMAASTAPDSTASSMPATPAMSETLLVPVQISPQRLQSIGVKTGVVERRLVEDEIRATGNVAVGVTRAGFR